MRNDDAKKKRKEKRRENRGRMRGENEITTPP